MKRRKILIILAFIALIVAIPFIKSQTTGTVIGNPDYKPSYRTIDINSFPKAFGNNLEALGLPSEILTIETDNHWDGKFTVNETYSIDYDEGYLIFTFQSSDLDADFPVILNYIRAFIMTFDARDEAAVNEDIETALELNDPNQPIDWKELYMFGQTINLHFDIDADGTYELHVEDNRMSY